MVVGASARHRVRAEVRPARLNIRRWTVRLLQHVVLILAVLAIVLPFLWIVMAAFKTQISLLLGQVVFTPTLANFEEVLFSRLSSSTRNFRQSAIVASASTAIVMVVAFLAAFSLFRLSWRPWVVTLFLIWAFAFNMIPPVALAASWYELFRATGFPSRTAALVLAHATLHLPMALFLLGSFLREVPVELEEAAYVDGAGLLTILHRVILPVMMPGVVATAILVFIFSWNEFPVALALTNAQTATVPVGISKFAQENDIKFTQMAAASVLSAIPALIALIVGQRFIVKGLTAGAVK